MKFILFRIKPVMYMLQARLLDAIGQGLAVVVIIIQKTEFLWWTLLAS